MITFGKFGFGNEDHEMERGGENEKLIKCYEEIRGEENDIYI